MRPETDELEPAVIGLAVDKDQIRSEMAVPMIPPISDQCVITISVRQRLIGSKQSDNLSEFITQR